MSIAINPQQLKLEMTRRGLDGAALARTSRLSPATVSAALSGKPVAAATLVAIARALTDVPAVDVIDSLISASASDVQGVE